MGGGEGQYAHEDGKKMLRTVLGRFHIMVNHLCKPLRLLNVIIDTVCSLQVSSHCH